MTEGKVLTRGFASKETPSFRSSYLALLLHNIYIRFVFTFHLIFLFYKVVIFRLVLNVLDFSDWLLPNWHGLGFLTEEGEQILDSEDSCRFLSFETIFERHDAWHLQMWQVVYFIMRILVYLS